MCGHYEVGTWQHVKCLELDIAKQKKETAKTIRDGIDKEVLLQQRWLRAGGGFTSAQIKYNKDQITAEVTRAAAAAAAAAAGNAPRAIGDRRPRGNTPPTPAPAGPIALQDIGINDRHHRRQLAASAAASALLGGGGGLLRPPRPAQPQAPLALDDNDDNDKGENSESESGCALDDRNAANGADDLEQEESEKEDAEEPEDQPEENESGAERPAKKSKRPEVGRSHGASEVDSS